MGTEIQVSRSRVPTIPEIARVPYASLPAVIATIERALIPATPKEAAQACTILTGYFKIADNITSPDLFMRGMAEEAEQFPPDILNEANRVARRTFKWLPSIAEMYGLWNQLVNPRQRALLFAKEQAEGFEKQEKRKRDEDTQIEESVFEATGKRLAAEDIKAAMTVLDEIAPDDMQAQFFWHAIEDRKPWVKVAIDYLLQLRDEHQSWPRTAGGDHPRVSAWKRYLTIRRGLPE